LVSSAGPVVSDFLSSVIRENGYWFSEKIIMLRLVARGGALAFADLLIGLTISSGTGTDQWAGRVGSGPSPAVFGVLTGWPASGG
jgi:hypothetical protein